MGETGRAIIAIVSSVVGLSIVAVILSARSNTAGVIGSAGSALAGVIGAATSPVTGGMSSFGNLGMPSLGGSPLGMGGSSLYG